MNLETQLKPELWTAIKHSYEAGNYTHAIKDAMATITDVLRDKSGLDGDGDKLVGTALGFSQSNPPKIKINKLQTQTEQDMQRGLMFVLKGMYALVRNPRTHERLSDDKKTADTIILFINYLLGFLGTSYQSFTVQDFLGMVTDPHFVPDAEYVKGLADKVPARKQYDTVITLYRQADWQQSDNFELMTKELLSRLDKGEISDFLSVVSEDLQKADKPSDVTLIIKLLPEDLWAQIEQMPRLRAENMLLEDLKTACYSVCTDINNNNAATWISQIACHCLRKQKLRMIILNKLKAENFDHHNFVAKYLLNILPFVFKTEQQINECVYAIADCIREGNEYIKDCLNNYMSTTTSSKWIEKFVKNLKDLTDPNNPEIYLPDGTAFLGKFVAKSNPSQEEDDIPF